MLLRNTITLFLMLLVFSLNAKVVEDFGMMRNWKQNSNISVPSGKYGFSIGRAGKPARMWYKGTSDIRDLYAWTGYGLNYDVSKCDYIVLKYKLTRKGSITIDIWFDGKMVFPRPIGYRPGNGKWQELAIPVKGKKVTKMNISIAEGNFYGANQVYEVLLKEIRTADKKEVDAIRKAAQKQEEVNKSGKWKIAAKKTLETVSQKTLANRTKGGMSYSAQGIVVPTPKIMRLSAQKLKLTDGENSLCSIELPLEASEVEKTAAKELALKISKLSGIPVDRINQPNASVVFAVGRKMPIFEQYKIISPTKKEGYVIQSVKVGKKNYVMVRGKDNSGVYWAVQTLKQLMSKKNGQLTIPAGKIIDWPYYKLRSMAIFPGNKTANLEALSYKINALQEPWFKFGAWDSPSNGYKKRIHDEIKYLSKRGINIAHEISPFHHRRKGPKGSIRCSVKSDVEKLYNTYKISLEKGNRVITLAFDDATREKESFRPEDRNFFKGNELKSHAYLVSEIAKRINKDYPGTTICITTKSYQTSNDVRNYYDAAGVPKNVKIQWTGDSTITTDFTKKMIREFKRGLEGRKFILFDNTPGRRRGIIMFDDYASGFKPLLNEGCYGVNVLFRFGYPVKYSELSKIMGMTIAEYLWNADKYTPSKAVRRIMVKTAGRASIKHLLEFKKHFLKIASTCPVEKNLAKLSSADKKRYRLTYDDYRDLEPEIIAAGKALVKARETCKNKKLISELEAYYDQMIDVVKALL